MPRRVGRTISGGSLAPPPIWLGIALLLIVTAAPTWAKSSRTLTTANGKPIRKVYIYTDSPVTTDSAATQLTQDTCLTVVTQPSQADAILQLGMVLPLVAEGGGGPDASGASTHRKKKRKDKNGSHREVSVTCNNGDEGGDCGNLPTGVVGPEQDARWTGNVGGNEDVTLVSTASEADELWEPDAHTKQSWSDQLRVAVGCPVCPGDHFHARRGKDYQAWMQATCPGVLAGGNR